jgi:hypothetical protein
MVDRYLKVVLTVIALALAALALRPLFSPPIVTAGDFSGIPAKSFVSDTNPKKVDVPRSWG